MKYTMFWVDLCMTSFRPQIIIYFKNGSIESISQKVPKTIIQNEQLLCNNCKHILYIYVYQQLLNANTCLCRNTVCVQF